MKSWSRKLSAITVAVVPMLTYVSLAQDLPDVVAGCGTATVDGFTAPLEWQHAGAIAFSVNVPEGGAVPAELLVLNDDENLYMALRVLRSSLDSLSHFRILFDNDNDGTGEDGDDFLAVSNAGDSFVDAFWSNVFDPPSLTFLDTIRGGTSNGSGAVANDGTYTVFELRHPLNSNDDLNDFSLNGGDRVGFTFTTTLGNVSNQTRIPTLPELFLELQITSCSSIMIDIKPSSARNPINLRSNGQIPVAVLTAGSFDATQVNWATTVFGPAGANESHQQSHVIDIDMDGDMDVVLHFRTAETGLVCDDAEATLTGETFAGVTFTGTDVISIVKCPR